MNRFSRQKINKSTEILNGTKEKLDLINLQDTTSKTKQNKTEYTFFSSAHGTFFKVDYILGHKTSLNKFKRPEIISSIFSEHNSMKLEINHGKRN